MISALTIQLLKANAVFTSSLPSYSGGPAIFADVAPEQAEFPNITVRTMQTGVRPQIKIFNVYIDYWDYSYNNSSRLAAKVAADRIELILDGYRYRNSFGGYKDIRYRFLSGYAATREEYNGVHYNCLFSARATREEFMKVAT